MGIVQNWNGSWKVGNVPLPDAGFTEWAAGLLGQQRNSQGGSNLIGPSKTNSPSVGSNVGGGGYYAPSTPSYTPSAPAPSNMGSGSVLGTSSGGYSTAGYAQPVQSGQYQGTGQQQTNLINDYSKQQEGLINNQYSGYRSYLDNLIGTLPQEQQALEGQVGGQYDSQLADITTGQKNALTDTGRARTQTQENKASSFRDLEENLRNSLYGANQYLGVMGASNSSGANRYAYALTKANNKERAGINKQANASLADIQVREEKINNTAQSEVQKLNNWKSNQLLEVSKFINDKKSELQQRIAQGEVDRGTALRELNASVFPAAMQRLQQIDSEVKGYRDTILKFAMDNLSSINSAKSQLGQLSSVAAPEFVANQLNYIPQYAQQADQVMSGIAPGLFRKDQNQFQFAR